MPSPECPSALAGGQGLLQVVQPQQKSGLLPNSEERFILAYASEVSAHAPVAPLILGAAVHRALWHGANLSYDSCWEQGAVDGYEQCLWSLEAPDPQELELQAVVRCLLWMLGTELRASERAVCTLNC